MTEPHFEQADLLAEYVQSLQDQLDGLRSQNDKLKSRIAKLETQAEKLEQLVPRRKRKARPQPRPNPRPDRSITIPAVGLIPDLSLPVGPVARPDLTVACVVDGFSEAAFRYEFDLLNLDADRWEDEIDAASPEMLLVESAYRGVNGSWAGRVARFGRPDARLDGLVSWCRERNVPTVFWNKEDPINHDWFTASASLFDVVMTVDSNVIDTYERHLGHSRVGLLPFGAQPVIHHPPSPGLGRPGKIAFAGAYYAAKHPERRRQMDMLLRPALDAGLDIFDRMDRQHDPRFAWPDEFQSHIVGSLTYPQTLEVYRRYETVLNVNTVTNSPSMCARRVYELLASGTRTISGPSDALADVPVDIAHDEAEARRLIASQDEFDPRPGYDWVQDGNLMTHRVDRLLEMIS